jgi:hypothetical protein
MKITAVLVMISFMSGCAAVPPMVTTAAPYVASYMTPETVVEHALGDDAQDAQAAELEALRTQVRALQIQVDRLEGPRQLVVEDALSVQDLRRLDTLARDRDANQRAFHQ